MELSQTKRCNGCDECLPFSAFSVLKPGRGCKNNLASRCKRCRAARNLKWHEDNRERSRQNRKAFYDRNRDSVIAKTREWQKANPDRNRDRYKTWAAKNRAKLTAKQRDREISKLKATLPGLRLEHRNAIQDVYDKAAYLSFTTGIPHHVDHIFPLQGKNFSGLHVPWNLQILTAFDNISKKNKVPADLAHLVFGAA